MKNKENKWTPGRAPAQPREAARGRQRTPPEAREGARSGLPGSPRRCPTEPCVLKETRGGPGLRAPCSVRLWGPDTNVRRTPGQSDGMVLTSWED